MISSNELLFFLNQLLHLLDKVILNFGQFVDFFYRCTLTQRFIHDEIALAAGSCKHGQKLLFGLLIKILYMTKTITALFQRTDCFLECFLISLADAHDFADCSHLSSELILYALELFKCPAREFQNDIIAVRNVFIQCAIFTARNFIQSQTACQHCRNKSDRETGCLTCKCRRSGSSGVDFNNNNTTGNRIMCKLYIRTADHLNCVYDTICLILQLLLYLLGNRQHWSGTEGITGMHANGINVFNKAYGNHISFCIADNFQLQLFPSKNGLFYQNLTHEARLQTSCADCL